MSQRSLALLLTYSLLAVFPIASSANAADKTRPKPHAPAIAPPPEVSTNPLLPPPAPLSGFLPDLAAIQKLPTMTPAGFDPLYTAADWSAYRQRFGTQADNLAKLKSSAVLEFSNQLITAAAAEKSAHPGLSRLLLFRAAAICYRNRDGFPTADKAVAAYQQQMNIDSATQVGALWSITNAMSRLAVTPKPERIRYSGIAARANTQLCILLVDADQIEAADSVIKMVAYHEGWLKSDPATRKVIAQTRAMVHQTQTMMDYLATQYQPAINGDDSALMSLFIYGRFVKNNPALVADFPARKPSSPMAQLAAALSAGEHDQLANFTAAETLRLVAKTLPEGVLKQRTLYAALERYRQFVKAPEMAHERIKLQQAVFAMQAVAGDGARPPNAIHPFETPKPAEIPADPTHPAVHSHAVTGDPLRPATPEPHIEPPVTPQRSIPAPADPDGPIVG